MFQPFDDQTHLSGAIYLSINNLLQSKHLKPENIILVGMMLGLKEAGTDRISYYLEPFVAELIDLYSGVSMTDYRNTQITVRAALMCVACDIPAVRKTFGFTGYMSMYGCHQCQCQFKTSKKPPSSIILDSITRRR
ncbi:hypothetical protein PHYBLDRAFT_68386 [Phycomyces blakesleeanus NRRL 1555(-)]|uniref:Uncharacterized protein n=1 Tax=Phycomyces blakesleeanus (strain ATCC 8743b / DSM 1359 / FGSC 10004 / NBRC 33097 / NRRL 1555) TaxID=763407 RepID=A0A163B5X0_PHYB8|nr:hypothetical protein PHYBLDRAFT_68386 [Phycomyces blakesleeanus NRRL 1555(-)]OAD78441.1 hypothetical protein PHYBLDRAFT_68386 [Phycomyces blakesleeanus NRRL 1555(-)]|eukprot:XP_018296481.1 hypothetical protein PHYBLDRAFT_68386 [Phycomyces blakesleeanus NRRL 1555(-)]